MAPISYRITVVLTVVILAVFFLAQHGNDRRAHALLQNDANQAAAVASAVLSNEVSVLNALAVTVTTSDGSPQAFLAQARKLVHGSTSVALAKSYLSRYVVFAAAGDGYHVDQVLDTGALVAFRPGGVAVNTGPVLSQGALSTATFAVGAPLVPSGNAIYLQMQGDPFAAHLVTSGSGSSDLDLALYGSDHPLRTNLFSATSSRIPLAGPTASALVTVGNSNWTIVARARNPLLGGFVAAAPLIILILGLCLAFAVGGTVELLVRRRAPALMSAPPKSVVPKDTTEGPMVSAAPNKAPPLPTPEETTDATPDEHEAGTPTSGEVVALDEKVTPDEKKPTVYAPAIVEPDELVANQQGRVVHAPPLEKAAEPVATPEEHVEHAPEFEEQNEHVPVDDDWAVRAPDVESSFYADWRPDPFGRFEERRFFLGSPTSLVRDGSIERYDPHFPGDPTDPRPTDSALGSIPRPVENDESPPLVDVSDDHPEVEDAGPTAEDENHEADAPSEAQQALEAVAARVVQTINEEIDGLRTVIAAASDLLPESSAPTTNPDHEPVTRPPTPEPPQPQSLTPPPPPHPPKPSMSVTRPEPPKPPVVASVTPVPPPPQSLTPPPPPKRPTPVSLPTPDPPRPPVPVAVTSPEPPNQPVPVSVAPRTSAEPSGSVSMTPPPPPVAPQLPGPASATESATSSPTVAVVNGVVGKASTLWRRLRRPTHES